MKSNGITKSSFVSVQPRSSSGSHYSTHDVVNMPPVDLPDQNLFTGNVILQDAAKRENIEWATDLLTKTGAVTGSSYMRDLARLANEHKPVLKTHNRIGERIDFVEYHPAYHEIMKASLESGVHSLSWTSTEKRPHVARSMLSHMWHQVENGTQCPIGMSFSVVPLLRSDPELGDLFLDKVLAHDYDPRPIPAEQKTALTFAMSMTEKQGGSDLRANSTTAVRTGNGDREYVLNGHKFFCSAPMGDLVLFTAQSESGVSLFVTPRSLPDGTRNGIRIQRLKDKLGNVSNASAEVELENAIAYRIGEEGHGIREFIKNMTHYIRMDFSIAPAGLMRQALSLAMHHTSNRSAFGKTIRDQPQMRNTLADLALEYEAAALLGLRGARACDDGKEKESDELLSRILVPISKFWNCRRACAFTLEALECHGGMGFVEEQPAARLYREAPLNAVWEGTSAVMGLDMIRAINRTPESLDALLTEIRLAGGADSRFDRYVDRLETELVRNNDNLEPHARRLMTLMATAMQGSLMIRQSTPEAADIFCASRLDGQWAHQFGTLDAAPASLKSIVDRAEITRSARYV